MVKLKFPCRKAERAALTRCLGGIRVGFAERARSERSAAAEFSAAWFGLPSATKKSAQNTDGDFIVARGESDQFFEGTRKVVVVLEAYPFGYFFKGERALV